MTNAHSTRPVFGFLIDPHTESITRIDIPGESRANLDAMYKAIGCNLVEVVYLNRKRDGVFVDEEGLLKEQTAFFFINGTHQPLAGRGIVLGCDEEGETISPKAVTIDWLKANTAFMHRELA